MALEIYEFNVTIAAGTPLSAPATTQLSMPPREVQSIEIKVPPGPRGEVGFQIGSSGASIIPRNSGGFIVTDDEVIDWPLEGQHDSGSWQLIAYNTGQYSHSLRIRFKVQLPGAQRAQATTPIPAGAIDGGGLGTGGGGTPPLPPPPPIPPPPPPPGGGNPPRPPLILPPAPPLPPGVPPPALDLLLGTLLVGDQAGNAVLLVVGGRVVNIPDQDSLGGLIQAGLAEANVSGAMGAVLRQVASPKVGTMTGELMIDGPFRPAGTTY